jgi:formylglycine-generating enzyme required for sulfatase activity
MVFVDAAFCPDTAAYDGPERRCLSRERNRPNNITICNRFAEGTRCRTKTRRQRFCIDRYEYPNRKDAHPPVMVSAYDGAALCAERGKRLCWESEWMAACEGPGQLPFPYGYERSAEHCNIDNRWRQPSLRKVYSDDRAVREAELKRLDQSVPSGAKPGCKSGFGVHDLTGNFDEWVMTEWRRGTSDWAGLKGGAWGHVRNACRPITTSHSPQFTYYFISFRCCSDPDPAALEASKPDDNEWKPPPVPDKALKKKNKPHRGWPAEPAPR